MSAERITLFTLRDIKNTPSSIQLKEHMFDYFFWNAQDHSVASLINQAFHLWLQSAMLLGQDWLKCPVAVFSAGSCRQVGRRTSVSVWSLTRELSGSAARGKRKITQIIEHHFLMGYHLSLSVAFCVCVFFSLLLHISYPPLFPIPLFFLLFLSISPSLSFSLSSLSSLLLVRLSEVKQASPPCCGGRACM